MPCRQENWSWVKESKKILEWVIINAELAAFEMIILSKSEVETGFFPNKFAHKL